MQFINTDEEVNKSLNLPLTPMIDVFVNLLCFFLIGGHFRFAERQLESELPKQPPITLPSEPERDRNICQPATAGGA